MGVETYIFEGSGKYFGDIVAKLFWGWGGKNFRGWE